MMNYRHRSDHLIRQARKDLVDEKRPQNISKNLTKNFIIRLANLHDTGLLSSGDTFTCEGELFSLNF